MKPRKSCLLPVKVVVGSHKSTYVTLKQQMEPITTSVPPLVVGVSKIAAID